jgi:hypothetical protein
MFSKHQTGHFPDEDELIRSVEQDLS